MNKQMYYEGEIYASKGKKIHVKNIEDKKYEKYIKIEGLGISNYFKLYNRALRHGIHNFYKINDKIDCIVIKKKVLFYKDKELINTLDIEKGSRPLRNGIVCKDSYIIYSEYYGNKDRDPVNVYKYNFIEDKKEIIYTFNNIRHIHFIEQDINNEDSVYIGTGDEDNECSIYKFDLKELDMKKIGSGSQTWRAVSILQTDKDIYWGTDDPIYDNYIVKYNFEDKEIKKLREISGPAYYSTRTKNGEMYIATTIEDRKKHKAIIYKSIDGVKWKKHKEFRKDIFHTKYFGYGVVEFINNQESLDKLVINLKGLR